LSACFFIVISRERFYLKVLPVLAFRRLEYILLKYGVCYRCLSLGVNYVYYGLKSCIFIVVEDLWITGKNIASTRRHEKSLLQLNTYILYAKPQTDIADVEYNLKLC
jgi:hypothetical protein